MKRYLTIGLVLVLVASAAAAVLVSNRPDAPYGTVDLAQDAKPAGLLEDILGAFSPTPPPAPPTAPPPGYEPVQPEDRVAAGEPSLLRSQVGTWDGGAPGLFASFCEYSHSAQDDPIVFPGQPGASHLHDFFGAPNVNAYSTDDSIRSAGQSNCSYQGDTASYWVPRLYENGISIVPDILGAYYRAGNKDQRYVEPFPTGFKMVVKSDQWRWYCVDNATPTKYSKTSPSCPEGEHLGLEIVYPDCWDGKYLDVPDHISHMAYAKSTGGCPSSHPVYLPQLIFFVNYAATRGSGDLKLAPLTNPSAVHADFYNSWDQWQQARYVRDCIKADIYCGANQPSY
jgi:hypothetical protein